MACTKTLVFFISFFTLFLATRAQYNATLGKLFGQLTVASYCIERQITSWSCVPCKKVTDMKFVHVFKNRTNDTCGYIGVNDAEDAVVLVFRGTLPWDIKNWISDINFLKKKYPYCDNGCEVHRGFMEDYNQLSEKIILTVKNYTKTFGKSKLYVTGHSLGGALSTLAVADLMHAGIHVDEYYSLGSPRVGDKKFFQWFNRKWGDRFKARITHHKDPVPHLPFELWGFHHLQNQIFYNKDNSYFQICNNSGEDKNCSNKYMEDTNVLDHLTYLGLDYTAQVLLCQ